MKKSSVIFYSIFLSCLVAVIATVISALYAPDALMFSFCVAGIYFCVMWIAASLLFKKKSTALEAEMIVSPFVLIIIAFINGVFMRDVAMGQLS